MKRLFAFIVALFFFSATGIYAIAGPYSDGNKYVIGPKAQYTDGKINKPRMVVYHHGNRAYILGFIKPFGECYFKSLAAANEKGETSGVELAGSVSAKKSTSVLENYISGPKDFYGNDKKPLGFKDFTLHGEYYVEGATESNVTGTGKNLEKMVVYYHELTLDSTLKLAKATTIHTLVEARDEIWGKDNAIDSTPGSELASLEENIVVRQAYGKHKFAESEDGRQFHQLWAGLMECGVWGTKFKDGAYDSYRARYEVMTPVGLVTGIAEKVKEASDGEGGMEENDDEYYILSYTTILGLNNPENNAFVQAFAVDRKLQDQYGDAYSLALSVQGKYKSFGYEGEMDMLKMKWDNSQLPIDTEDTTTYGAYLNVWKNAGPLKLGILGAYGSFAQTNDFRSGSPMTPDNEPNPQGGFAHYFGDDFDGGGALLLGDTITFYDADNTAYVPDPLVLRYLDATDPETAASVRMFNTDVRPRGGGDSLAAGRLIAVYADYSFDEKLHFGAYAGYATCGVDIKGNKWTGATAWELSGDITYTILPRLQYEAGAGIGQLNWGDETDLPKPDKAYKLYHKLTFAF